MNPIEIKKCELHGNAYNEKHPCPICVDIETGEYASKLAEAKREAELRKYPSKICPNCETEFFKIYPSNKAWAQKRFCSHRCAKIYRKIQKAELVEFSIPEKSEKIMAENQ